MESTEQVEGLGENISEGWEDYPLDAVFVRNENRTVAEIDKRVRAKRYQLDPDFQRDFVWTVSKQSRLIESCLMRIPLPVFYVAETKTGVIAVVDGLQRLTTFNRYLANDFALSLEGSTEGIVNPLNGLKFSDLPLKLQERIEDTQLTLYILDAAAPERAKLDIFERVNSGVPLTRQQMRNCLYNGRATKWLKSAALSERFLNATGRSLDAKSMRDREAINRFCAFYLIGEDRYRGDMDGYLAQALEIMQRPETDLQALQQAFLGSMRINHILFQDHAFRKSLVLFVGGVTSATRSILNISLFDVCSVIFADAVLPWDTRKSKAMQLAIMKLLNEEKFVEAITYSTNSTRQVQARFRMARKIFSEVNG